MAKVVNGNKGATDRDKRARARAELTRAQVAQEEAEAVVRRNAPRVRASQRRERSGSSSMSVRPGPSGVARRRRYRVRSSSSDGVSGDVSEDLYGGGSVSRSRRGNLEEGAENRREKTGTGQRLGEIIGESLLSLYVLTSQ